jgi:hypothetical protein
MSDIIGFDACTEELRRLIHEIEGNIKTASQAGPDELHHAVMTETRKLVEFTNLTEPQNILDADEIESINKIDQVADKTRRDIFGDSANQIIARMQDRISQLNQLEKAVRQQAANNEEEARKIRLIPIRNAVDAVTETVVTIREAKDALSSENPEEAVVKSKIENVIRAITALEKAAQNLT